MREVPGLETQEHATYPASLPEKCRTAAVHAEDRVQLQSTEGRKVRGVCGKEKGAVNNDDEN